MGLYFRLSIGGEIGVGEKWSINPAYDPNAETALTWNDASGLAMATAAAGVVLHGNLKALIGATTKVSTFRLEGRDSNTHDLVGVSEYVTSSPQVGTSANVHPLQTAVAVSLRTATAGARGRGRLYWPAIGAQLNGTTLRLTGTPDGAAVATSTATYLKAVGAAMQAAGGFWGFTTLNLCVISKAAGTAPHVNQIQVGDVVDTQRRRRDRQRESYVSAPY